MKKYGFTLVELLAVIVILAIILAIAVPSISGIMDSSTRSAFQIDAKMVLKQIEYEKLQDATFDVASVNEDTIVNLNISNSNYETLKIGTVDSDSYIIIVGKGKWTGLKACGNIKNIKVVDESDTACESMPIIISSMHPKVVSNTCNPDDLTDFCISEISLLPYAFTPAGHLKCDGGTVTISNYPTLYSLIGFTFGGDGRAAFALPNLTSNSPLAGLNYYISTTGNSPDWNNTLPLESGDYSYFSYPSTFQNYLIGEIILASNVDENNSMMLPCDGRTVMMADYPTLYSLIGLTFGGDGRATFALPNLSSASSPVDGAKYYIIVNGLLPIR